MNVLDEIRPRADHLSEQRSHELLNAVLSSRARKPRRRWNRLAAIGLFGAMVAGGTAYGTGLVPDIVTDRFQQIRGGDDGWPYPIYGEQMIADVPLSNGKHARVWSAETTGGRCVIRDMTDTATEPEDFGVGCWSWMSADEATDARRGVHWQISEDGPAVVYGDFAGVSDVIARVDVAGPGWTRSFSVEEGAFAGEVPAGTDGDRIRFVYGDPRGDRVASKVYTVGIESE